MTPTRLTLSNFRSYHAAEFLFPARLTFLTGRNNAGKSSAVEALRWCLVGQADGVDKRGAGVIGLAWDPRQEIRVEFQFEHEGSGYTVVRRAHPQTGISLQVTEADLLETRPFQGSTDEQQQALYEALHTTEAMLLAMLDGTVFFRLHHADGKRMVMAICKIEVTDPISGEVWALDKLDEEYDQAFTNRRDKKRALDALRVPPAPEELPPPDEELIAQLETLRAEERTLLQEKGGIAATRRSLETQITTLETRERGLAGRVDKTNYEEQLARFERELAEMEDPAAAIEKLDAEIALLANKIQPAEDTLTNITGVNTKTKMCVLGGGVPCLTSSEEFQAAAKRLREGIATWKAERGELQKKGIGLRAQVEKRKQHIEKIRATKERIATQAGVAEQLATTRADLDRLRHELAGQPEAPDMTPLLAVQNRIREGERVIREARMIREQQKAHEDAAAARATLVSDVERLEHACDLYGPKGIRLQAISHAITMFETMINDYLAPFGYTLKFSVEPWTVLVNNRPYILLSTSEKLRVGVAFQLALASASRLMFAVIDQIDLLDAGNRRTFTEVILGWDDGHLLLAATKDDDYVLPTDGVVLGGYRLQRASLDEPTTVTPW